MIERKGTKSCGLVTPRFTAKEWTGFRVACHPVIVTDTVDFPDMKTGDEIIIREYYRRRDD
jgi:hypothetical protein